MSFSLLLMLEWQTMCRKHSRVRNPSFFFSVHNPIKALHRFCLAFLFLFLIQIPFEHPSVNNSTELNWNHFSSARIDSAQCLLQLALITINAGGIQKRCCYRCVPLNTRISWKRTKAYTVQSNSNNNTIQRTLPNNNVISHNHKAVVISIGAPSLG